MYLIDPIPVTPSNGVLFSSTVPYPDQGSAPDIYDATSYPRWVQGGDYPLLFSLHLHLGRLYRQVEVVPPLPLEYTNQLPPGHPQCAAWVPISNISAWSASGVYSEGDLVQFPVPSYNNIDYTTNPSLTLAQRIELASTPLFGDYEGYPCGTWRRNSTPDDGQSIRPKLPSLVSKYWDEMEPPLYAQYPEIPLGELTTFDGRVWRKRTATQADHEAPPSAPNDWAFVKISNRWAMFDASVGSPTKQTRGSHDYPRDTAADEQIEVVLHMPSDRIFDALALLGLDATTVRIQIVNASDVTIYDQAHAMQTTALTHQSVYSVLLASRRAQQQLLLHELPASIGATVTLTITRIGGQAACGLCVLGQRIELGGCQRGLGLEIKDYSVYSEDEFGRVTVTPRGYSKRASVPVQIDNTMLEPLLGTLADYRSTPALWVPEPTLPATAIFGYYKSLKLTVAYPTLSTYSLNIEGTAI